jgi:hypothetical protein
MPAQVGDSFRPISLCMAVDTRLLSFWAQAQASRLRDSDESGTPTTVSDAYDALISRIEQQRMQLYVVAHRER